MHRPQRWRPSREATPARTGCPSCTVTQARRRHAMVVAHFFDRPADAVYRGADRERTANGRRSSAGQHRVIAAIDEKAWAGATSARPGRPGSHSVSRHWPRRQAREQSTRGARSSHPFGRGLDRSPVAPPGTGCSPANGTPEELRHWLVPACYQ